MTSAFFGLNIGATGLRTAQTQVDITNQNIANANTPGYSRQSALVSASQPWPTPTVSPSGTAGQLGTGVQVNEVVRARNTFADNQISGQFSTQGEVDAHKAALAQVEATINEPSTTGLTSTLTKYWAAWHEVANSPADSAVRNNLLETGKAVADTFQTTVVQYQQQQRDLDQQVVVAVTTVNTYAGQIAGLNAQIAQVESNGMHANDLRDQRGLIVDQLSKLVPLSTVESATGQLSINVGSHQLVDRQVAHLMQANNVAGSPFVQPQWSTGTAAIVTGTVVGAPAVAVGGSMTINGVNVPTAPGQSAATVAGNINAAVGLGPAGAVTASVAPSGALVLTSNTKGSLGTVVLGPVVGSAYADFGFVAGTTTGVDDPVNLSTGQLKGLVDSRDILVLGQITSINALASRIIESVNSMHASGVGIDGKGGINFFSAASTNATNIALNATLTVPGGTDHIAAARMVADSTAVSGYSSAVGDSSNAIAIEALQNQISQRLTSTPVVPGQLVPGGVFGPSTLLGLDLSGAAVTTTYTFTAVAGAPPTVSVNDGTTTRQAAITLGADALGNKIITVDTGVGRLTLSAAAATTLSNALVALNGPPNAFVTTQPAPATIGNQYASQVAALGVQSKTAQSDSANQLLLVSHLNTQRQQVSGVSLDEETINLIMYQKAYQASARVVTVVDGMLDTLINHMKL